jgi:hypothetical protein
VKGIGSAYGTILASFFLTPTAENAEFLATVASSALPRQANHLLNNMVLVQGVLKEPHPRSPILAFKY